MNTALERTFSGLKTFFFNLFEIASLLTSRGAQVFLKADTPLVRPEVTGAFGCKSTQLYGDPDLGARRQSAALSRGFVLA